jgi:hypothetical protein
MNIWFEKLAGAAAVESALSMVGRCRLTLTDTESGIHGYRVRCIRI